MSLAQYMALFGWNLSKMARESNLNNRTIRKALDGETISSKAAIQIAQAVSRGMGVTVHPGAILGLRYS